MSKNILKIENLNLYYDDKQVLKDLNLNIEKNSITAISGPSGIGKSSLLLVLNQMIKSMKMLVLAEKYILTMKIKILILQLYQTKSYQNLEKKLFM